MYKISVPIVLSLFSFSLSSFAAEQTVSSEKTENTVLPLKQKSGYQAGSFMILPTFSLTDIYDSNIFSTRTNTDSGHVLVFSPSLEVKSNWARHELQFSASADLGRYNQFDTEDYDDFNLGTSGRYDINDKANIFGGLNYSDEHESRATPESAFGRYPTKYSSAEAHAGTEQQFDNIGLRFGGTFQQLDYHDVATDTIPSNNDDRDRDVSGAGLRLSYAKNQNLAPFAQVIYDHREYKFAIDDNGFQRDSSGYRLAAGLSSTIPNRLKSEVYLGHLWQNYDDNRFSEVSEPDFGATVRWRSSASTLISANIDRAVVETTLPGSSSSLETSYGVGLKHKLLPDLTLKSHVTFSNNDYQDISRDDDYIDAGFGLEYNISRNIYLAGNYRYLHRNSNISYVGLENSQDYYRHQYSLTVGARLYPVRDELEVSLARLWGQGNKSESGPAGFYVGGQVGYNALDTHAAENRTEGGSDDGAYGNADFAGGLFAGYGFNINRWYLGLEFETENSNAQWSHRKDKSESRTLDLAKNESYGASLRLGRALINNGLVYGRIGAVKTRFDGYYTLNDSLANAYDEDFTVNGIRLGIGLEYDLSDHLFGRMDYSVTDYQNERIASVDFNENYSVQESLFNLGVGWRFNAVPKHTVSINPNEFTGPYAGVQVGHGITTTNVNGLHRSKGGQAGPYDFDVDFADHGFTPGAFIGYGMNLQRVFMGLELEGEVNSLKWEHVRDTPGGGGRDFSVEVRETVGATVKLGYILDGGALLYVRGGGVRTNFTILYAKGNNRNNDLEFNDELAGIRVGIGVEVPLTERSFVRLDYNHTNYESIDFVTQHGNGTNSDEMTFDSKADKVILGVGTRF